MNADTIRGSRAYRALTARIRREHPPECWLCGKAIDLTVPYRDPATHQVNAHSWSMDHIAPLDTHPELALDPANCRPAHYGCNSARGKRAPVRTASTAPLRTSRAW